MCTGATDASYNTGIISFTMWIYVTDTTSKQYLYCKNKITGNNVGRGWCMGLNSSGNIFVEVNTVTGHTATQDTVETIVTPLTFTVGWNMIG